MKKPLPPSSLPRSTLPSVQTLSQSSSSQTRSATATAFNPKRQNFLFNSPIAPPKFQTLSPLSFCQVFYFLIKTTSDQMSSPKPTKLIAPSTSVSSSSKTLQSSQLKFQLQSSISPPILSPVSSPCTHTFPSSRTPTAHPSFSVPASRSFSAPHLHQFKVLKVLLMYLFVTLIINKVPGSDNRYFLFNIL